MRTIVATAQIFAEAGKPVSNHPLIVEAFSLESNRWDAVEKGRTNAQGLASFKIDGRRIETNSAPALRLIEEGTPAPRVLAQGGVTRFDARRQTLHVDFGQIDRLEETAFTLTNSAGTSGFGRVRHTIAGVALQEGRNEAALNRNLEAIAGARESLTRTTRTGLDVFVADTTRDSILVDGSRTLVGTIDDAIIAPTSTKELDTLKSINLEQNQLILRKDAELTTSRTELLQTTTRLQAAEKALEAEKLRADDATAKVAELEKASGVQADVTSVVTGIGTKLSLANQTLQAQAHPFRIGTVRLDLSGRPSADGSTIELGGTAEQSGSKVSTELHVGPSAATGDDVTVPDVIGLTENAARRVIRSVGLRLSPARQTLKPNTGTPGQSISQHPAAGAQAKHGSEVLVVFGAAPAQ